MKKLLLSLLSLSSVAFAQTAKLQVIHNSAVPAADTVDVYANGLLLFDDLAFRTAKPYADVDAGVNIRIGVALKGSNRAGGMGVLDTIAATGQTINLPEDGVFVGVANGLLSVTKPDTKAFQIFAAGGSESTTAPSVGLKFFHGATDAPAVDIVARGVGALVSGFTYGNFTDSYLPVPAASYIVDINPAGTTTPVASYTVDLSSLAGGSAIVLASGFLSPTGAEKGFAVIAALPDGRVITFPTIPTGLLESKYQLNSGAIYPNPATDRLFVNDKNINSIEFADNAGMIVKTVSSPIPSDLDVSDLKTGIYLVKMVKSNTIEMSKLTISK